jgi:hypothetical protein
VAVVVTVLAQSCVVVMENVTHEARRGGYPGYAVEYVDASPAPGTLLTEGEAVRFDVRVRYVLQSAERGTLALQFQNERSTELLPSRPVALEIARGDWAEARLTKTLNVPGVYELYLRVPVVPDGVSEPVGALRIRYPVTRR